MLTNPPVMQPPSFGFVPTETIQALAYWGADQIAQNLTRQVRGDRKNDAHSFRRPRGERRARPRVLTRHTPVLVDDPIALPEEQLPLTRFCTNGRVD